MQLNHLINMNTNSRQGFYVTMTASNAHVRYGENYTNESIDSIVIQDDNITIYAGSANNYQFGDFIAPTFWNGAIMYTNTPSNSSDNISNRPSHNPRTSPTSSPASTPTAFPTYSPTSLPTSSQPTTSSPTTRPTTTSPSSSPTSLPNPSESPSVSSNPSSNLSGSPSDSSNLLNRRRTRH